MDLTFWNGTEKAIIDRLTPYLLNGTFSIDLDGKIRTNKKLLVHLPWVFIRGRDFGDCYLYHDVFFEIFGIIPSFCQAFCWKIVIQPRTVKELFETYETLRRLNFPSKCGTEERPYVQGQWGAYIYCNGLEQGQQRFEIARKEIPDDIPVVLKRGCTEFEITQPSDKWTVTQEQSAAEQVLMTIFQPSGAMEAYQPQWIINAVKRNWIAHAYKLGDDTYKELIPEKDWQFFPKSLTYQKKNL